MSGVIKAARVGGRSFHEGRRPMGDPGLFGGLFGAIKGGVSSLVSGGNPISGAIRGGASGFRGRPMPVSVAMPGTGFSSLAAKSASVCGPGRRFDNATNRCVESGFNVDFSSILPGGAPFISSASVNGGGCPSGHHTNKSDYFLRDGSFVAKGTRCVKNRRRNAMNPRALDRAIGRINSGKKLQHILAGIETGKFTKAGNRKACPS